MCVCNSETSIVGSISTSYCALESMNSDSNDSHQGLIGKLDLRIKYSRDELLAFADRKENQIAPCTLDSVISILGLVRITTPSKHKLFCTNLFGVLFRNEHVAEFSVRGHVAPPDVVPWRRGDADQPLVARGKLDYTSCTTLLLTIILGRGFSRGAPPPGFGPGMFFFLCSCEVACTFFLLLNA